MTAMDVFPRYLFAYPTSNQDAKTIAKVIINIMTKHAYLPTTLITDKGSAFVSDINKEVASVLTLNTDKGSAFVSDINKEAAGVL